MKVLWLCNMPSPYRVDFFNELNNSNVDIFVCFDTLGSINRNKKWFDNKKINFNYKKIKGIKYYRDEIFGVGQLVEIIKRKKDHIIVVGNYSTVSGVTSIALLKLLKVNFIINTDGGFIRKDEKKIKYLFKKMLISSATYWLSTGEETTKYLLHYGANYNQVRKYKFSSYHKNEILDFPISESQKSILKESLKIPYSKVIMYAGNVSEAKGVDTLLRACDNLNDDIGIYIIGGKPDFNIEKIRKELVNKNIFFIEFINKEDLIKYYQLSDLLVFPSKSDVWGLVVNEAMSNALPVITTEKCIAGLELIENEKNGHIIKVNDYIELEKNISKILNDKVKRLTFSKRSLEKIKEYSIENMAERHIEIFTEIRNILNGGKDVQED